VRFDPGKFNWLGSTNRETQAMYVWHTAPAQVLEDIKSKEIAMGAQAPGSTQFDYPVLANNLLGSKFKGGTGYESTPKSQLTVARARRKSLERWRGARFTVLSRTGRRSSPSIRLGPRKRNSAFSRSGRCRRAPSSTTSRCPWILQRAKPSAPRCG